MRVLQPLWTSGRPQVPSAGGARLLHRPGALSGAAVALIIANEIRGLIVVSGIILAWLHH
jgi:hypothetical protein